MGAYMAARGFWKSAEHVVKWQVDNEVMCNSHWSVSLLVTMIPDSKGLGVSTPPRMPLLLQRV